MEGQYHHLSDLDLLYLMGKGDQCALEMLFERHYYSLCNFAFQYVRDFMLTEEIVSDVFLKIWLKGERLEFITNFKAYVFTAVRNEALNYLRKENPEKADIEELEEKRGSNEFNADRPVLEKEMHSQIEAVIRSMPPRRACVFRLSRLEGFTYKEIAGILSISVHTVQNHMVAALKQFSHMLIKE